MSTSLQRCCGNLTHDLRILIRRWADGGWWWLEADWWILSCLKHGHVRCDASASRGEMVGGDQPVSWEAWLIQDEPGNPNDIAVINFGIQPAKNFNT